MSATVFFVGRDEHKQRLFDYSTRTDGQPVYIGAAVRGISTASSGWTVALFTYSASGFITKEQVAYVTWAGRTTGTYA